MARHGRLHRLRLSALAAFLATSACFGTGIAVDPQPLPERTGAGESGPGQWPIATRMHVDLWLHGFALLQADSTRVPFFRRGYAATMGAERSRAGAFTMLDANRDRLAARFLAFPNLVSAHFIPLYFGSWEETRQSAELFLRAEGNPRRTNDERSGQIVRLFSGYFPTQPDREWLRLFLQALDDERTRFYAAYWREQQRAREGVIAAIDSLWSRTYRPRLARFATQTGADGGTIILSLPLDGEGRTLDVTSRNRLVAIGLPDHAADAREAIYVFAHEIVASVTATAIEDNTTPAERRAGTADRWASPALVRGGALLLQRVAPELVDGYARYYLAAANVPFPGGDATAALAAAFPVPDAIRDAIRRQIDVVLGGI